MPETDSEVYARNHSREDKWTARLNDWRTFEETSSELQVEKLSPWRELERIAKEEGVEIVCAEVFLGMHRVSMLAIGAPLVCGTHVDWLMDLATGRQTQVRYRWICRQGQRRWLWRITDGANIWELETTPGRVGFEKMPAPPRKKAA